MKKLSFTFFIVMMMMGSFGLWAQNFDYHPEESPERKNKKKFQIELYGGFSTLNPADLNLRAEGEDQEEKFFYQDYYDYLKNYNLISYNNISTGEFKNITNAIPYGFRLKYYLNPSIAISLGLKYLSRNQVSHISNQFQLQYNFGEYREKSEYSPFTVSAKALTPMLGLHLTKHISDFIALEGYFMGGPLWAECSYAFERHRERLSGNSNLSFPSPDWRLEEKGTGTGLALEAGVRINKQMWKNIHLFIEGGYAYQVVKQLSGPGNETYGSVNSSWEGDWGIKELNITRDWGNLNYPFPSNYWEATGEVKLRDFKLDLSGFQLRMGFSYRF
ncbi:MAG: hypothetical protein PVH61_35740 [Candidatus Aminicenantes bacterium]|jgi:hypothetical protein